jgi:flagellar motor switch protein FliN/FliY
MPATTIDVEQLQAVMAEAAEAAAAALPVGAPLLAGFAGEGTEPSEFHPGEGSVAVACRLRGGVSGRLVIMLTPELAQAALDGPLGAGGLTAAVEPAMSRAAAVLDQAAPRAVRLDAPMETDPSTELEQAAVAFAFLAAPLFDGEEHRASVVLLLDDPAVADVAALDDAEPSVPVHEFPAVAQPAGMGAMSAMAAHPLRLLHDVEMDVTVELGRTRMTVRNVLGLVPGSVVELDRAAGAPVDLLVNGTLIGRGEVVVIDEEFGVRISELIGRNDEDDA